MVSFKKSSVLFLVTILASILYYQGVHGPFLYDDFSNLNQLAIVNNDASKFYSFILGNHSGPLGRPVVMASFLLNSQSWPTSPYFFKLTNILIHLVSGWLFYLFLIKLLPRLDTRLSKENVNFIALIAAAFWLLHPLHVSTTLYIIQRMTQLSAIFSILAMISFLKYQESLVDNSKIQDFILPSVVLTGFISLAVLSKENALLVFPTIILINFFITKTKASYLFKVWYFCLFILPSLICFVLLIEQSDVFLAQYEMKNFTMGERLLTQSRVIIQYLQQIVLPDYTSMSIYHDDVIVSKTLINPLTTIYSVMLVSLLVFFMFIKIHPIYRFSIAWFFLWHLMESTLLPLDLYFEHRNYIASLGPLLSIAYAISQISIIKQASIIGPRFISIIFGTILSAQLGLLTAKWSDEETLYNYWLTNHQTSKLTFNTLTQYYMNNNELPIANKLMDAASKYELYQNDLDFNLMHYTNRCIIKENTDGLLLKLTHLAQQADAYTSNSLSNFKTMIANILNNNCRPTDLNKIHKIITTIIDSAPQNKSIRWKANSQLYHSYVYLHYNEYEQANDLAVKSYKTASSVDALIKILQLNMLLLKNDELLKWTNVAKKYNKHHYSAELTNLINQLNK